MIAYKIKLLKAYKVWKEGKVLQVDKKLFDQLTSDGTAEEFKSVTKEDRLFKFLAQNEGKFPDIDRVAEDEVADVVKKSVRKSKK